MRAAGGTTVYWVWGAWKRCPRQSGRLASELSGPKRAAGCRRDCSRLQDPAQQPQIGLWTPCHGVETMGFQVPPTPVWPIVGLWPRMHCACAEHLPTQHELYSASPWKPMRGGTYVICGDPLSAHPSPRPHPRPRPSSAPVQGCGSPPV